MIDYTKIVKLLIEISTVLFAIGLISKVKIIFITIKGKNLVKAVNFMKDTLNNDYNKNIIHKYLETEFGLKKDETGDYKFTFEQMAKTIRVNKKKLDIVKDKYINFLINITFMNIIDWCYKKSIKLAFNLLFISLCLVAGQAYIDFINK